MKVLYTMSFIVFFRHRAFVPFIVSTLIAASESFCLTFFAQIRCDSAYLVVVIHGIGSGLVLLYANQHEDKSSQRKKKKQQHHKKTVSLM